MNSSDVYTNSKEINELNWYSCGSLGTWGCVTWSIMFVNGYSGICVIQGIGVLKSSVNNVSGNEEAALIDNGFL